MSRWLSLAESADKELHTPPDSMTIPDKTPSEVAECADQQLERVFCRVLSNCQVGVENSPEKPRDDCRHGYTVGGRPKTWSGKVVSLADWRALSEWEKHGPDGRVWNGRTRQWEEGE